MAKTANMFGFFLDEMHKAGGASSSSSSLSSAEFSAALDFALQPKTGPDSGPKDAQGSDVVSVIMRCVIQSEPQASNVVSLANATGLGLDAVSNGLDRAVGLKLLKAISAEGEPTQYIPTEFGRKYKG